MKRKRFLAVACAAAMIASMTTGLAVNVSAADEKSDFAGEELSILVSAGWMDNRYDETIKRFEDTYDVTVDLQTIPADQYSDLLQSKLATDSCADIFWIQSNPFALNLPSLILRNTASTLQELPGRMLCRRQEKSPAYTMTNCTDFRSGTHLRSM